MASLDIPTGKSVDKFALLATRVELELPVLVKVKAAGDTPLLAG